MLKSQSPEWVTKMQFGSHLDFCTFLYMYLYMYA